MGSAADSATNNVACSVPSDFDSHHGNWRHQLTLGSAGRLHGINTIAVQLSTAAHLPHTFLSETTMARLSRYGQGQVVDVHLSGRV